MLEEKVSKAEKKVEKLKEQINESYRVINLKDWTLKKRKIVDLEDRETCQHSGAYKRDICLVVHRGWP